MCLFMCIQMMVGKHAGRDPEFYSKRLITHDDFQPMLWCSLEGYNCLGTSEENLPIATTCAGICIYKTGSFMG